MQAADDISLISFTGYNKANLRWRDNFSVWHTLDEANLSANFITEFEPAPKCIQYSIKKTQEEQCLSNR